MVCVLQVAAIGPLTEGASEDTVLELFQSVY
jgi:hypothetical protein